MNECPFQSSDAAFELAQSSLCDALEKWEFEIKPINLLFEASSLKSTAPEFWSYLDKRVAKIFVYTNMQKWLKDFGFEIREL